MKKDNIKSAIGLTGYFISLPPSSVFIAGIFIVGLLAGLAVNFGKHSGIEMLWFSVIDGMLLLALPALLSSLAIKAMIRKMFWRRIIAVAFIGEVVYAFAYVSSLLIVGTNEVLSELILLIGAAIVFILWYAIARLVFILKYRSILFAIMQLLFYLVFLVNSHLFTLSNEPVNSIAKFYVASFILFGALYIFFLIINAPMKKSFGFSSTDAISLFVSQWLYQNQDLEKAFESVGVRVKTLVTMMGFSRKNGMVYFVAPAIHFGPFGNLGGSEFSHLIAKAIDAKHGSKTFVFHGTATHDLNPVSSKQLANLVNACEECIENSKPEACKVSYVCGTVAECRAETLLFNKSAMVGLSRAPYVTEDIGFGLGLGLMKEAEKKADLAMVVDQHNAETGEITSFDAGDPVGFKYMGAVTDAFNRKTESGEKLSIGVSFRDAHSGCLGNAGIKVAVISSNPEYVVVLIDSNGVTPIFRETIIQQVKELGKSIGRKWEVGVFTTDTHQTNMVRGVLNPLQAEDKILSEIKDGAKEAAGDMSEAKFFCAQKWFEIDVLGAKQSIEIVSTVNSIVAVAKIALPLIMIAAVLLLIAIFTRI